jgi:adenylate cyclase
MAAATSIDELSRVTGEPVEELRRWRMLGLLGNEEEGSSDRSQQKRVRTIQFARRHGFGPERIASALMDQPTLLSFFEEQLPTLAGRERTLDEAIAEAGVDRDVAIQVRHAAGLDEQTALDDADVASLRAMAVALQAGLPLEALLQLVRVYADALGRVAEAENRTFHLHVHEQFRAQGLRGQALLSATQGVSEPLLALVQPTIEYFHQKAWERATLEDMLLHLVEDVVAPAEVRGEMVCTVMFIDLVNFTPLTLAMGDAVAAAVVDRFQNVVRSCNERAGGRIVKQIGDAFMLVFSEASGAVRCGLDIQDAVANEPDFPGVHMGAHTGRLLYREGDYLGNTVNIAARVAGETGSDQMLVTEALRDAARDAPDAEFIAGGARILKGVAKPVQLLEVHRRPSG